MRFALVHIRLATWPSESLGAVAGERSRRVHANTVVLTRRSLLALVNVLRTVDPLVARRTGASERAIDRTRVADCIRVAGIRRTCVVQMAQKSSLARRTAADKAADTVDTGGAIEASRTVTIVDIDAAIGPCPAVDTYARVTTDRIRARRSILAHRGSVVHHIRHNYCKRIEGS